MNNRTFQKHPLALAVAIALTTSGQSYGQETEPQIQAPTPARPIIEIEEVVVTARLKDSATAIIHERMEQAYSAEILGVEQITKAGDSNIASALRRVTGLTLIDGKYVYVRGLGERYSSTTLNGAAVPSPELTRNVIPLDLFPTSILDSVKIHKAYSADQPAAFGGGNIDIRTRGVPDQPVFNISFGTGWDSNSTGDGLKLQGDGGGLPQPIADAIQSYQGNVGVTGILKSIHPQSTPAPSSERMQAAILNRDLLVSLNRSADFGEESLDPDFGGSITVGQSWNLNDDFVFGVLANYESKTQVRNEDRTEKVFASPESTSDIQRTVEDESITTALNLGLSFQDKHFITTNSYIIESNEDQSRVTQAFDSNFEAVDGRQKLTYDSRLEQRKVKINQIVGEHSFEEGDFGLLWIPAPFESIDIRWIYSDSNVTTDVPNSVNIEAQNIIDPSTFEVLDSRLRGGSTSVAKYSFLGLEDNLESYGMHFEAPFSTENFTGSISGGWLNTNKTREYYGYTANIGVGSVPITTLTGIPNQVLTDSHLSNLSNEFELTLGTDFGTESYIGAYINEAVYGGLDVTWQDTWRLSAGARWELYEQAVLPVDLLDFSGVSIQAQIDALQQPGQTFAFEEDDYYPAVALTYLGEELFGSDSYQVRFGVGKSVVRPDLREKAPVQYIDPETGDLIQGNPGLFSADINQIDLRMELFYSDGTNLTASLFYKDIDKPIETIKLASSGDNLFSFINGKSAEVYGIEFEAFKELGAGFFINGNLTLSDSESDIDSSNQTNPTRPLTGHSDIVTNLQLGYDSDDGKHSGSLVYNYFSERLLAGGINLNPDRYEDAFHSLDLIYAFYPTYNFTIKTKIKNILGEDSKLYEDNVDVREQERGTSIGIDVKYEF